MFQLRLRNMKGAPPCGTILFHFLSRFMDDAIEAMIDVSAYKVGLIVQIKDCGSCKTKGKLLRECQIRINPNDEADLITVVTSAANVREGSR